MVCSHTPAALVLILVLDLVLVLILVLDLDLVLVLVLVIPAQKFFEGERVQLLRVHHII